MTAFLDAARRAPGRGNLSVAWFTACASTLLAGFRAEAADQRAEGREAEQALARDDRVRAVEDDAAAHRRVEVALVV
ncbi:MAG: hypothetical protein ACKOFI_01100, partial [Phycisphaerales bacterium]